MTLFESTRLVCRRVIPSDVDAMAAVYGDADAMRWVDDGRPLDRRGCQQWIGVTLRNYAVRGYGMSALLERASGEVIGFIGLVHPGGQSTPEIKYALKRAYWGMGYATEAVRTMLDHGAREFAMQHIIATVAADNVASQRVLLKAGMTHSERRANDDGSSTCVFEWRGVNRAG
jgi:RimJ/RimL family protein N-acetyltransferase